VDGTRNQSCDGWRKRGHGEEVSGPCVDGAAVREVRLAHPLRCARDGGGAAAAGQRYEKNAKMTSKVISDATTRGPWRHSCQGGGVD